MSPARTETHGHDHDGPARHTPSAEAAEHAREHEHGSRLVERRCDVLVVGGSAAGLAAALQLGRQRRSVIVVDAGQPRNAPAAHMHSHLGHEGLPPERLGALGREEVRSYGGEVLAGTVERVTRVEDGGFRAMLAGGHAILARRVIAATGLVDELPAIDGLAAFEPLGLQTVAHPSGLGEIVPVDPMGETPVDGLFAAGNVTDPSQQVAQAAANGSRVGGIVAEELAQEDLRAAAVPSANEADWDARYGGERMWSGNPNGALVHEVGAMSPGRALDVGAGEGGDAVWLAEQGWQVVASDVSTRALARVSAAAEERGVQVEVLHADANALDPFGDERFDLVIAMYASIPRTPDGRGVHHLLDAVAPGGTLLVVSHDLEPMRTPIDTATESRGFDPDAYVRVEDVAAAIAGSDDWTIEVHEQRARPEGAASAHHVEDVVLRARRSR